MGWSGGTDVCENAWSKIRQYVKESERVAGLAALIQALQENDWDCEYEIEDVWPESNEALALRGIDFDE